MPPSESTPPFESKFPEINPPKDGWHSNIPPHLLDGIDPQMEWLLTEMSKNTQATQFAGQGVSDISRHLRELNGRTGKNERATADIKERVESLKSQAKAVAPFIKPVMQFAALWEFRPFRWVFYAATFFFFTYLLPWYLKSPFSIDTFVSRLFGSP